MLYLLCSVVEYRAISKDEKGVWFQIKKYKNILGFTSIKHNWAMPAPLGDPVYTVYVFVKT